MKIIAVGSRATHVELDEVRGHELQLGGMYHVVFECYDDDGLADFGYDTALVVNSLVKKPGTDEFRKMLRMVMLKQDLMLSQCPEARFFGPLKFEVQK